ncbi:[Fe-Fe] hydrogenase large subunit C-terminal domain-containing protein [Clostridium sp.]|uniref:[Fe-Fe] hydrogenase large subunit C-terminal domain-containing protein n=1 Tax=Clostridium sp. TaxID=1506 RepID=UPI002851AF8D|nr:[Fe-Fe] hydrogenase large subunit C-terminal domain-containing protein [Clostridium sp.]MDR3593911.1 [Fe-Fe] hydrogenase large subunit C-terminal domain-containing protein [Clostridium sp.]
MAKNQKVNRIEDDNIVQINKKKCIGCTACAFTCVQETKTCVLKKGYDGKTIIVPKDGTLKASGCLYCGQCILACPVMAIEVRSDTGLVKEALKSGKYLVLTASSAVKATLGEEFNLPIGTYVGGKIAPSAKKIGFHNVFDTNFGNDMVSIEDGMQLVKRIASDEKLPMFTSICSVFVRYMELYYPEMLGNISNSKSPQQMMGVGIKTYFAETYNILPTNIFTVSIQPCTSKKYEAQREEMGRNGYKDIDAVLTVKEYADFLKENGVNITAVADEKVNYFMGEYTDAAEKFAISGGAVHGILATAANYLKSDISEIENIKFKLVNGYSEIMEAIVSLGGKSYKVAAINGLKDIEKFILSGKWKEYLLIEAMGCRGGCLNGGGTPIVERKSQTDEKLCIQCGTCVENCPVKARAFKPGDGTVVNRDLCVGCKLCDNICRSKGTTIKYYDKFTRELIEDYVAVRANALKNIHKESRNKLPTENENLENMYENYIGDPDGMKANNLLHTNYCDRSSELKKNNNKRKKH